MTPKQWQSTEDDSLDKYFSFVFLQRDYYTRRDLKAFEKLFDLPHGRKNVDDLLSCKVQFEKIRNDLKQKREYAALKEANAKKVSMPSKKSHKLRISKTPPRAGELSCVWGG
jgi:hypothetical protein